MRQTIHASRPIGWRRRRASRRRTSDRTERRPRRATRARAWPPAVDCSEAGRTRSPTAQSRRCASRPHSASAAHRTEGGAGVPSGTMNRRCAVCTSRDWFQQGLVQIVGRSGRLAFAGSKFLHEPVDKRFDLRFGGELHQREPSTADHQTVGLRLGQDVLEHQFVAGQALLKCLGPRAASADQEVDARLRAALPSTAVPLPTTGRAAVVAQRALAPS